MAKKDDELKKLREQAKLIGLDVDTLVEAIAEAAVKKISIPDLDSLAEKVYGKLAKTLTEQISQAAQAVQEQKIDTQAIVTGVAQILQPQIIEAANQANAVSFAANGKALIIEALRQVDEKVQAMTAQASGNGEKPGISNMGNLSLGSIIQKAFDNPEALGKIIDIFRPKPSADEKIIAEIVRLFRINEAINKIKQGETSVEVLTKIIKPPAST